MDGCIRRRDWPPNPGWTDYHQVDARDGHALARLVGEVYKTYGRLDGGVHGAGIIEDKLIEDKTPESFDRVFDLKAESAFVLSRALRPESLKFFALFSSAAGSFGNPGQSDYSAANQVLSKLAIHLDRHWPGRVVAFNWGPWLKTGMVSEGTRKQFADRGVQMIGIAAGRQAFMRELEYGRKGEAEVIWAGSGGEGQGNQGAST